MSYLDKDSISHRINNFIWRLPRAMNINIFTFTRGRPTGEILMEQTDRQSDHRNPSCACVLRVNNIQGFIEEPEIHIMGMSSSSIDDQAALIGDRVSCINLLNTEVLTSENIAITDRLLFFSADKPAVQFEQGTQVGATIHVVYTHYEWMTSVTVPFLNGDL